MHTFDWGRGDKKVFLQDAVKIAVLQCKQFGVSLERQLDELRKENERIDARISKNVFTSYCFCSP